MQVGGEEHSGWLPEGFVKPLPTPVRDLTFDFEIKDDGGGHFILDYESDDGSIFGDTWHETLDDAIAQANYAFGIVKDEWTFHA